MLSRAQWILGPLMLAVVACGADDDEGGSLNSADAGIVPGAGSGGDSGVAALADGGLQDSGDNAAADDAGNSGGGSGEDGSGADGGDGGGASEAAGSTDDGDGSGNGGDDGAVGGSRGEGGSSNQGGLDHGGGSSGDGGTANDGGNTGEGGSTGGGGGTGGSGGPGGSDGAGGATGAGGNGGEGGSTDACAAVSCDNPPADSCGGEDTLTSYASAGRCRAGDCEYHSSSVACTHGCAGDACSCTANDAVEVEPGDQFPGATSIDIDSTGGLHVAYWMDEGLQYAYRAAGGSWVADTLEPEAPSQVGWYPSVFVDADDGVHIAYGVVTTGGIRYAYRAAEDDTFDFEIGDADADAATGENISLGVDGLGGVHIAHRWGGELMYTYKPSGGAFATITLEPPGTANNSSPSLVAAPDGTVYIAFVNAQDDKCLLATKNSSALEPESFSYSEIDSTRQTFPSLAVDADGGLHVALYDPIPAGDLHYGYRAPTSSTWQLSPVDTAGTVGLYADIATDRFGGAHISYYDQGADGLTRDLKYAYKAPAASASAMAVDGTEEGEDVGESTSIVVDGAGVAHISYANRTEDSLNYLRVCPAE